MALVLLGWGLGFLLAAPHLLPLLEYAQTGSRMIHRNAGIEERPQPDGRPCPRWYCRISTAPWKKTAHLLPGTGAEPFGERFRGLHRSAGHLAGRSPGVVSPAPSGRQSVLAFSGRLRPELVLESSRFRPLLRLPICT